MNIAGMEFGCNTNGVCKLNAGYDGPQDIVATKNAAGQMNHFVKDDGLNAFRLPVSWQYLANGKIGGALDGGNLAKYDSLVQSCVKSGAQLCIIDMHNYARVEGGIIGSDGGPSNEQFADLWRQLAEKYASVKSVAFGIMNEPHDMPNLGAWAKTVQAAVTAIRNAGAAEQLILLPGNEYTAATTFVSGGSAEALKDIKNPDGSNKGLIFDVHVYLDADNSGKSTECTKNNVDAFTSLAKWLRDNNRQAINTEVGGGNTDSCKKKLCEQIRFLK